MERRPFAKLGLDPDAPLMSFDNLLADGQANSRSGILLLAVQPLEYNEDALEVLLRNANPIVAHGKLPLGTLLNDADVNLRPGIAAKLHRVADQILEQLCQLNDVALDRG